MIFVRKAFYCFAQDIGTGEFIATEPQRHITLDFFTEKERNEHFFPDVVHLGIMTWDDFIRKYGKYKPTAMNTYVRNNGYLHKKKDRSFERAHQKAKA